MNRRLTLAVGLALTAPSVAAPQGAPAAIDTMALRAHSYFLSTDDLGGRAAGTVGADVAALYIAEQLRGMGLRPAFGDGYTQRVPLVRFDVDAAASTLALNDADGATTFHYGADFVAYGGAAQAFRGFAGAVTFYGTAELALQMLGTAGPSLDGRVLALLGPIGPAAGRLVPDWIRRGAEGVILMMPDSASFRAYAASREDRRYYVDARLNDAIWQPPLPMLIAGPDVASALLAGVPVNTMAARGGSAFQPVDVGRSVKASIAGTPHPLHATNVGAVLQGSAPDLRNEYVALSAHYDHLGTVSGAGGDSIYNGFTDNAAGVAMALAIADAMRRDPPARSTIFLFFTAEERGLLGSTYYTVRPAVPLRSTVAEVNLDAGAPPAVSVQWRIAGATVSTLGALADSVVQAHGWEATASDPSPNSDYWPFLVHGVPAVFPIPEKEWEGVTPAEKQRLLDRFEHYHQPQDEWAPTFPFVGMLRYAELVRDMVRAAADARPRPSMTVHD